jgi:hypothetical protein
MSQSDTNLEGKNFITHKQDRNNLRKLKLD